MELDEQMFFDKMPSVLPIYETLRERLLSAFPSCRIRVSKTQISFGNRYLFAMVSLPRSKRKGWPETYLLLSFGLSYQKDHPRIVQTVEAYPGRWTHHVLLEQVQDVDEELMDWIEEAYQFSMVK